VNFRMSRIGQCRLEVYAVVFMGFVMQNVLAFVLKTLRWADLLWTIGFLTLAIATALLHFVLIGLLGLGLVPVSLGVLLVGYLLGVVDSPSPWRQKIAGFTIFFFGILTLMWTSVTATTIAYDYVTQPAFSFAFSRFDLVLLALGWLTSVASITLSFTLKSSWSTRRCLFWEMVAWVVPAVSLLFFWILFLTGQTLEA